MNRILKIPKFLHELHGEEASLLSVLLVYATGIAFALFCIVMCRPVVQGYQTWILALMALDIGGGVVSNFSPGTSAYYAKRPTRRWIFIAVHIIHPLLLWVIFSHMHGILVVGAAILVFTAIVNAVSGIPNQRMIAACLFVTTLVLINLLVTGLLPLLFLSVFALKLIIGFGVRWNHVGLPEP